ncbi:MAG: Gfo/Idh/MocA family oxidoreductase [Planctomycetales bacterium]
MSGLRRREFLVGSSLLMSGLHAGFAAEEKKQPVRLAFMGLKNRGLQLLSSFREFPQEEVEVVYLCDPDKDVIPPAIKALEEKGRKSPTVVTDFRKALDDKQVDALVCAAPDHWHALATIWACQAGKDVYVEKPISHNLKEGEAMVAAARKYNRVVQAGMQRRSGADLQEAAALIQKGELGKVSLAKCWIVGDRPNIGHEPVTPAPANLDFDLWCGPAPNKGYRKNLVHYQWHWRWDYGTGECGNNGIHAIDVARWGLGVNAPKIVTSGGGKYHFDDDQETPDTQFATFDYEGCCIQWEHRTWTKKKMEGQSFGVEFYGPEKTLLVDAKGWRLLEGEKEIRKHEGQSFEKPHQQNFLDCLRDRKRPNADIEIAHQSARLCHLANIAFRTRSVVEFDSGKGILNNPAGTALTGREYRKGFELPQI